MLNYNPLKISLMEKGMELKELQSENGGVLNKRTVSKLRHNRHVHTETIEKVCVFLDIPVEKVVEITRP